MLKIRNHQTGEIESLRRDVRHVHSEWVHEQLGTEAESELQAMLDQVDLVEYANTPGSEDACGMFMSPEDAAEFLAEQDGGE